ncbi:hypothetical protein BJ875DRAFT_437174 [Amylocarpus encephaloides]|uniref:Nuclear pore assembly and biogenesis-domain-containing protein n=1 Tax=Amylocarpus encephaloides TaxID=45428 RepID=A0A9P7YS03_9HELO|nr:hypothetical protein BJ875DRAFT_437174 [Amylocarpus encephaloides]
MDIAQDYAAQAYALYSDIDPYLSPIRSFVWSLKSIIPPISPILSPLANKVVLLAQDSPAIVSVAFLLVLLLVAIRILNFLRRVMMFWIRLTMRIAFWGAFGVLLGVVYQRGLGRTAEDLMVWGEELRVLWWKEYRRWEGYQNKLQQQQEMSGKMGDPRGSWR